MRVMLWSEYFRPYVGGVEVLSTRLAVALRRRGHDVTVVTSHGSLDLPDVEDHEGVAVHRFPFAQALAERDVEILLRARQGVSRLKRDFSPQLIHATLVSPSVFFHLQTEAASPAPLLLTQQLSLSEGQRGGADTVLGRMLTAADHVVGCSGSVVAELRELAPAIADRCSVIHNGIEPPDLEPAPLDTACPTLLGLGRLVADKDFRRAVEAMPAILSHHADAQLVLAGDGPERRSLADLARDLGVDAAVHLPGWVTPEDVPALCNGATLLLLPSRSEALPLVIMEAAVMGRPSIATDVGGVRELIDDGDSGVVIPPGCTSALADAVIELLASPARIETMGAAARARCLAEFTWDRYVDAYESRYGRLVESPPAAQAARECA